MTKTNDELRGFLRGYLTAHRSVDPVTPKTATSGKVHLSVYRTKTGKPIGVEFDKDTMQNIWVRAADAPKITFPRAKKTEKQWTGFEWKSSDGKGANSNLTAYDDFLGHDLIRFGVKNEDDAIVILEHLIT